MPISQGLQSELISNPRAAQLRCSRTAPACQNCVEASQACEYREQDRKRRPASHEYVTSLENHVAWLEALFNKIKAASPTDRDKILDAVSFGDIPDTTGNGDGSHKTVVRGDAVPAYCEQRLVQSSLQPGPEGSLVYHGATSIFRAQADGRRSAMGSVPVSASTEADRNNKHTAAHSSSDASFKHVAEHFGIDIQDELVTKAMTQFFKWYYPQFMFIYREAFLRDHFSGNRVGCKYWSLSLLLALCSLGTLMSPSGQDRLMSEQFFAAAESILLVSGLAHPSITSVQASLCLAFYEIGRGNLSKAWGFSGIAFRMAQDLGLQRDPKHWISRDTSIETPEDVEIRRRIYWGCYTCDKIISLVLGRPVQLYHGDAEVGAMERLPDIPDMDPWLPAGLDSSNFAAGQPLLPCFSEQIRLSKVVERMLRTLFSPSSDLDDIGRQDCIDSLNLDLCRWQDSLPDCAKWNKWERPDTPLIPSVGAQHMLFHSIRIALHYDQASLKRSPGGHHVEEASRLVCISAMHNIIAIVRKYRSQYGLQHAPIIFVYGIIQAVRATRTLGGTAEESHYLMLALDECSMTWALAKQAREHMSP